MTTAPLAEDRPPLPPAAAEITAALHRGLDAILGDDLVSLFLYGAVMFEHPTDWRIDFDFHALVREPFDDARRGAIRELYGELGRLSELGRDLDGYYVLLTDAARAEPPHHQLDLAIRDDAWALHRAHIHAGRYLLVAGADPREIVPEPTWAELDAGLRSELAFVETHPDASAFGILNGTRILMSFETRDVVASKYQAALWAPAALPAEFHAGVDASVRFYSGTSVAGDDRIIEDAWAPFVAYVRRTIPPT